MGKSSKLRIPRIYRLMADGTVPVWLGRTALVLTWAFLIPILLLTLPIWGSVTLFNWMRGEQVLPTDKELAELSAEMTDLRCHPK